MTAEALNLLPNQYKVTRGIVAPLLPEPERCQPPPYWPPSP